MKFKSIAFVETKIPNIRLSCTKNERKRSIKANRRCQYQLKIQMRSCRLLIEIIKLTRLLYATYIIDKHRILNFFMIYNSSVQHFYTSLTVKPAQGFWKAYFTLLNNLSFKKHYRYRLIFKKKIRDWKSVCDASYWCVSKIFRRLKDWKFYLLSTFPLIDELILDISKFGFLILKVNKMLISR